MNELNSIETHSNLNATPLNNQKKFRLNEINKIKDYFNKKIQERMIMTNKLSKYIAAFDYIDKTLIDLSGIASASFTLIFSLTTGITKKLLKVTRKKKKKHNKIVMLAKSKLNNIETLMSQTLIDLEVSHEEFKTIVNEKEKYEEMKESIRKTKSRDELSEESRDIRKIMEMHRLKNFFCFVYIKWLTLVLKHLLRTAFIQ